MQEFERKQRFDDRTRSPVYVPHKATIDFLDAS